MIHSALNTLRVAFINNFEITSFQEIVFQYPPRVIQYPPPVFTYVLKMTLLMTN